MIKADIRNPLYGLSYGKAGIYLNQKEKHGLIWKIFEK